MVVARQAAGHGSSERIGIKSRPGRLSRLAGSGVIACRVVADGKVIEQQLAVGPYPVLEWAGN